MKCPQSLLLSRLNEPSPLRLTSEEWWSGPIFVHAPFLEVLRAGLDGALGSLRWWGAALPMAGFGAGWAVRSLPDQTIL